MKKNSMKTIFIDESSMENKFFLLCGIIVDNNDLVSLNNDILNFKFKYGLSHLKELRKPMHKKDKLFLIKEIAGILKLYDVKVISVILGDNTLNDINNFYNGKRKEAKIRYEPLKLIIERFCKHLERTRSTGQVVFDSLDRETKKLLTMEFNLFITQKRSQIAFRDKYDFEKSIFSAMLFSNDNHDTILQIADLIGFALRKAFEIALNEKSFNKLNPETLRLNLDYLGIYWPLFEKNVHGYVKGYGIKLWNHNISYYNLNKDFCSTKISEGIINE